MHRNSQQQTHYTTVAYNVSPANEMSDSIKHPSPEKLPELNLRTPRTCTQGTTQQPKVLNLLLIKSLGRKVSNINLPAKLERFKTINQSKLCTQSTISPINLIFPN